MAAARMHPRDESPTHKDPREGWWLYVFAVFRVRDSGGNSCSATSEKFTGMCDHQWLTLGASQGSAKFQAELASGRRW